MNFFYPLLLACITTLGLVSSTAHAQGTVRVSVNSAGQEANWGALYLDLSHDGRFVAFSSRSLNLSSEDTINLIQVYLFDLQTGITKRISVNDQGLPGDGDSDIPSISADGRFIAFESEARNLVPGDTNGLKDIFVYDTLTETTKMVSKGRFGIPANGPSTLGGISADGSTVCFQSEARNLVFGDSNHEDDIFVHDLGPEKTYRVSVSSAGSQAGRGAFEPAISGDGQLVVFMSSSNLTPGQSSYYRQVYLHNRNNGKTKAVSLSPTGRLTHGFASNPTISADGSTIAFQSDARDLIPGVTNRFTHIYVFDRVTGQMSIADRRTSGSLGDEWATGASLSADGRYVSFASEASNLDGRVPNHRYLEVYYRDRVTETTPLVSIDSAGNAPRNGVSSFSSISGNGKVVGFLSRAQGMVLRDDNLNPDVFLHHVSSPILTKRGLVSQSISLTVSGGSLYRPIALFIGSTGGYSQTGSPCQGLNLDLANPRLVDVKATRTEGVVSFSLRHPAGAQGMTVQAVDLSRCKVTNILVL